MSNAAATVQKPQSSTVLRAVIIAQGVVTVWLAFAFLPLGVVGLAANAILAFTSHGENRKLFAGFAIAAAVVCVAVGLGLMAVSPTGMTEVVQIR